jgi:hypothetical protein
MQLTSHRVDIHNALRKAATGAGKGRPCDLQLGKRVTAVVSAGLSCCPHILTYIHRIQLKESSSRPTAASTTQTWSSVRPSPSESGSTATLTHASPLQAPTASAPPSAASSLPPPRSPRPSARAPTGSSCPRQRWPRARRSCWSTTSRARGCTSASSWSARSSSTRAATGRSSTSPSSSVRTVSPARTCCRLNCVDL